VSYAVRFIANYGVYVGRMLSPIGRNAFFSVVLVMGFQQVIYSR